MESSTEDYEEQKRKLMEEQDSYQNKLSTLREQLETERHNNPANEDVVPNTTWEEVWYVKIPYIPTLYSGHH